MSEPVQTVEPLQIIRTTVTGPGKIDIVIRGATPDDVCGPIARQMASQRAVQELRNSAVFLKNLQPMSIPIGPDGGALQDVTVTPVAYAAVYQLEV